MRIPGHNIPLLVRSSLRFNEPALIPRHAVSCTLVLIKLSLLAACASSTITTFEGGATPPPDQVVTIQCKPGIVVDAVDGDKKHSGSSKPDLPLTLYLTPGRHTISIHLRQEQRDDRAVGGGMMMRSTSSQESGTVEVSLDFKPGHTYEINYVSLGRKWRHSVRDITKTKQN